MKILLIQPPIRDFYRTSIRTQPIGLAYLAASLRSHGHEAEILDCQTEKKRSIPIPPELSYLQEYYPFHDRSPFGLYKGFYHFGMDWDEIRQRIEASEADAFGISTSLTPYHGEALEIARIIRDRDPGKAVIMGGAHATCDPEGILKNADVDYVVLGEGEVRLPLLLREIEKGRTAGIKRMEGIGYREDGEIRVNFVQGFVRDLDALPYPARDLLDLDQYRIRKRRATMLITSRGCPHQCAYCSARFVMGDSFRARSPEAIVQEMMECRERYGVQIFDIEDDNFTYDQRRAKQLLNLIIASFGEGRLELSAMNGVSFASMDEELIELMKRAGFQTLNLSFVSGDMFTKERMKRPKAAIAFDRILEGADTLGLDVVAYGIFGMPGQTVEEMVDTLIYLMGKRVLIGPSIYYPTPRTPLFERCRMEGLIPPHLSRWRSSAFPIETKEFDRIDLVTLFRLVRVINFIKGKIDQRELDEGMTWREIYQEVKVEAKVKAEVKNKDVAEIGTQAPHNKDIATTWKGMVFLVLSERSFFSLRKGPTGGLGALKEKSSKRVVDYFLEKAWDKPILKSRHGSFETLHSA